MTGSGTETLTAALRRLADEHASGLLSVATAARGDVVLELADGVPVGIGPAHDVSGRVGREAEAGLVAAAVVDELVDLTVAAIVGGGGAWTWDVTSDASMMPLPPGLATELTRRAVDAAQALAELDPDIVLQPARPLETHGEVGQVRELFDGQRSLEEVAELAELTVPATATHAMALVAAGVLSTGVEPEVTTSWTDTVNSSTEEDDEEDEDEPELWVMEPSDDEDDLHDESDDHDAGDGPAADARDDETPEAHDGEEPDGPIDDQQVEEVAADPRDAHDTDDSDADDQDDGLEWVAAPEDDELEWVAAAEDDGETIEERPAAATAASGDGWGDTAWLDDLDTSPDEQEAVYSAGDQQAPDARAALSSMLSELQRPERGRDADKAGRSTSAPSPEPDDKADEPRQTTPSTRRKEPKAQPGEVAEFLRELSRLALDDE